MWIDPNHLIVATEISGTGKAYLMNKTTIYLSDDQMSALDAVSRKQGTPKAQLIREAIEQYVVDQSDNLPGAAGIFADDEVNSTNLDDWLTANWRPE